MIYITGDLHGQLDNVIYLTQKHNTTKEDIVVILGDAGFNYYGDGRDEYMKKRAERLPITFLCIHGNHEMRPGTLENYKLIPFAGGYAYIEEAYPSIFFAKDGLFSVCGQTILVIGGAYSVDKEYRLNRGFGWWADEQPSEEVKSYVEHKLNKAGWKVDYVFTHTCPFQYQPTEVFLPWIDQSTVDTSTEKWFEEIEGKLKYSKWYCGHFHVDKSVDKIRFLFKDIISFEAGRFQATVNKLADIVYGEQKPGCFAARDCES